MKQRIALILAVLAGAAFGQYRFGRRQIAYTVVRYGKRRIR